MKSKLTLLFAATLLLAQTSPLMAGCCWGEKETSVQEEAAEVASTAVEEAEDVVENVEETIAEAVEAE